MSEVVEFVVQSSDNGGATWVDEDRCTTKKLAFIALDSCKDLSVYMLLEDVEKFRIVRRVITSEDNVIYG